MNEKEYYGLLISAKAEAEKMQLEIDKEQAKLRMLEYQKALDD